MSRHTLSLAELSGTELLEVWTAVVKQETGDVTRAVVAVGAKRHGPTARVLTRGFRQAAAGISVKIVWVEITR